MTARGRGEPAAVRIEESPHAADSEGGVDATYRDRCIIGCIIHLP